MRLVSRQVRTPPSAIAAKSAPSEARLLRRLWALSAALLVAITALTTPAAADFKTGRAAYVDGDFAAAIEAWNAPAETGAAAAQFALGTLYVTGEGVEQDFEAALSWFEKAAEQGHAGSQYNLGLILDQGWTGMPDSLAAAEWFKKAAAQRHAGAQYQLGLQNEHGWGVDEDMAEAIRWYEQAAGLDYASAQYTLVIYAKGQGVAPDAAQAAAW